MEEEELKETFIPPANTNTFGIPNDPKLLVAYQVYKPSFQTRKLKSERGRSIYAEFFIEDTNLGTLSDLCLRTIAKKYGTNERLYLENDPIKWRIHYDSVDVDLPLEKSYHINDGGYWRRVVLAKTTDKAIAFKSSYNWKNLGISLKFVELVEACPAEYWPKEEMEALALKIKKFVTEMHIRKLQSLHERFFEESSEEGSDEGSESSDYISDEDSSRPDDNSQIDKELDGSGEPNLEELQEKLAKAAELKALKQAKREAHEKRVERRKLRDAKNVPEVKPKKKPKPKAFFDIPIEEDEDDGELDIIDRRNLEKLLLKKKKKPYLPELCHHIDLTFLRFFDHLETFSIEFNGPQIHLDYNPKNFNFSYKDVENLRDGIESLHCLKCFRLCNSRMDAVKLVTLTKALQKLESLETVDFSYDQLLDDCGDGIYELFTDKTSIKSLELRGNFFSTNVLHKLADALSQYEGVLEYLGLSGNPLGDEGLNALCSAITGSTHIKHLCLTGIEVGQDGIVCCIANKLLRQHMLLEQLDLIAIPISWSTGVEMLKALVTNRKILYMDCRGCDLEYDLEFEIELLLRRNRYIVENPYIGDDTKTEEEVNEWVNRIKNPTLLKALEAVQKRIECIQNRPPEPIRFSASFAIQRKTDPLKSISSSIISWIDSSESEELHHPIAELKASSIPQIPFVYDPNNFNEEEFKKHVYSPGPDERFYYFQESHKKYHR